MKWLVHVDLYFSVRFFDVFEYKTTSVDIWFVGQRTDTFPAKAFSYSSRVSIFVKGKKKYLYYSLRSNTSVTA